jgi:hypothetical protein
LVEERQGLTAEELENTKVGYTWVEKKENASVENTKVG